MGVPSFGETGKKFRASAEMPRPAKTKSGRAIRENFSGQELRASADKRKSNSAAAAPCKNRTRHCHRRWRAASENRLHVNAIPFRQWRDCIETKSRHTPPLPTKQKMERCAKNHRW